MITADAILRGDRAKLLEFHPLEHPVALQLGGSDPTALARCSGIVEELGYDEINLNVGCPSGRVQQGGFGACLMAMPALVADCVGAMNGQVKIPVTVKTRIGIDDQDSYEHLQNFVATVAGAGCNRFIIHARKAWLTGLSPKENREIPPLRYDIAARLKIDFPQLEIVLNGGIQTVSECLSHLRNFDGVMVGRAAYHDPYLLAEVDVRIFNDHHAIPNRHEVLEQLLPYIETELSRGTRLQSISRHILGLCNGMPGARRWRRYLSENAYRSSSGIDVFQQALSLLPGINGSKGTVKLLAELKLGKFQP